MNALWIAYIGIQLVNILARVVGWFVLPRLCNAQAWHDVPSTLEPGRTIDAWNSPIVEAVYGNKEDGGSGKHALIWYTPPGGAPVEVPYMPDASPSWRARCWQERNSAANLKYVFAREDGPFKTGTWLFGRRTYKFGWQREKGIKVPVFSL